MNLNFILKAILIALFCIAIPNPGSAFDTGGGVVSGVMAPLYIQSDERSRFLDNLKEAKSIGVEVVSVDIWWGLVMPNPKDPNWEYYDWGPGGVSLII